MITTEEIKQDMYKQSIPNTLKYIKEQFDFEPVLVYNKLLWEDIFSNNYNNGN